jgi:hypothetical protein
MSVDLQWEKVRRIVMTNDPNCSLFWKSLNFKEYYLMKQKGIENDVIDCAHLFGKGSHPHMKYLVENIILLPRSIHTLIDQNIHPITLEFLNQEERNDWWIKIIGIERWNQLLDFDRNYKKQ